MKLLDCIAGVTINPMGALLLIGTLFAIWVLWRLQRSVKRSDIDLGDLIVGPDGKASWSKIAGIGGFMLGSWIMVYLTLHDRMTEWMFLIYYAICVGSPIAFAIIGQRSGNTPPAPLPQTLNVTMPPGSTVNATPQNAT